MIKLSIRLYLAPKRKFLFPTLLPFKVPNEEQRQVLECPFEGSEVKDAVWELGEDMAPCPDGFPILFFKHLGVDQAKISCFCLGVLS